MLLQYPEWTASLGGEKERNMETEGIQISSQEGMKSLERLQIGLGRQTSSKTFDFHWLEESRYHAGIAMQRFGVCKSVINAALESHQVKFVTAIGPKRAAII